MAMGTCVVRDYELLATAKRDSTKGGIILYPPVQSGHGPILLNQLDWAASFRTILQVSIFDTLPYIREFLLKVTSIVILITWTAPITIFNVVAAADYRRICS